MPLTKTTFYLDDDLRARLKAAALRRGTTVTALLAEGAERVLADERHRADKEELKRRAREATEKLRAGIYSGPPISDRIDEILYGPVRADAARAASPRPRYGRKK